MSEDRTRDPELHDLHQILDVEFAEAVSSEDPSGVLDPELQAYEVGLRGLRDAVVAMEEYEDGLGKP